MHFGSGVVACVTASASGESSQLFEAPRLLVHCTASSELGLLRPLRPLSFLSYGIKHGDKLYVLQPFKRLI